MKIFAWFFIIVFLLILSSIGLLFGSNIVWFVLTISPIITMLVLLGLSFSVVIIFTYWILGV